MPVPEPSPEHRIAILEMRLAQAAVDLAAKDAFVNQLVEFIENQDRAISELSIQDESEVTKAK